MVKLFGILFLVLFASFDVSAQWRKVGTLANSIAPETKKKGLQYSLKIAAASNGGTKFAGTTILSMKINKVGKLKKRTEVQQILFPITNQLVGELEEAKYIDYVYPAAKDLFLVTLNNKNTSQLSTVFLVVHLVKSAKGVKESVEGIYVLNSNSFAIVIAKIIKPKAFTLLKAYDSRHGKRNK